MSTVKLAVPFAALSVLVSAGPAWAGGYDTPILYSAQHMAMGGAAIGYVDDPSAMFHNPAGLMGTNGLTLMANVTAIIFNITASPAAANPNEESETGFAVAPLVGVSYDLDDTVAFALSFYPVASAGAEYIYQEGALKVRNFTSVRFLELSPGVAFKIPGTNLSIGAGYRVSFVSLGRYAGAEDKSLPPQFDVSMAGTNFTGFRLGAQWQPIPELELGIVYRSLTRTEIEDDEGTIFLPVKDISTEFTLPAKLGFGVRANLDPIAIVLDLEYGFYSQNKSNKFVAKPQDPNVPAVPEIVNVSNWEDAITLRTGVEYGIDNRWFFRGGFLYDGKVSQEQYPSAFGTPPTSTMTITGGVGYKCGDTWELNFAVAQRFGATKVERGNPEESCLPCSYDGDYKLSMTGIYLDFVYAFPNL